MSILIIASILLLLFLFVSYKQITLPLSLIILLSVIIRLFVTLLFVNVVHHDTQFRKEVATKILQQKNIYFENNAYTTFYLPPSHYIDAIALYLEMYGIPQMGFLKTFYISFEIGIIVFLYKLSKNQTIAPLLYAINPISILVTNVHGQSDVGSVFFLLGSLFFLTQNKSIIAHLFFAFSVLWKTWPIIFVITILRYSPIKRHFLLTIGLVILSIVSYGIWFNVSLYSIVRPMLSYRGLPGMWGYTSIIFFGYADYPRILSLSLKAVNSFFVLILQYIQFMLPKKNIVYDLFIVLLVFFIGTAGFGMQWAAWIVPFLLLIKPRLWRLSTVGLTVWLGLSQAPWVIENFSPSSVRMWINTMIVLGWIPWISFIFMVFFELKKVGLSFLYYNRKLANKKKG